jgi:hypothetical protein
MKNIRVGFTQRLCDHKCCIETHWQQSIIDIEQCRHHNSQLDKQLLVKTSSILNNTFPIYFVIEGKPQLDSTERRAML